MTNNKLLANRRNALMSTGPRTPAGRMKSSGNALAHGLYATTVVPALGETPAALAELSTEVRQVLRPEGVLEERLCDRVALILLRLDRVARFEAAVATQAAAALAGDSVNPDTVTGDGIDICRPPHAGSPPAFRLAYARARVAGWEPVRDALRTAVGALADEAAASATIASSVARRVVYAVGEAFGWGRDEAVERWGAAIGPIDDPVRADAFRIGVHALAAAVDRDPNEEVVRVRNHLIACEAEYDGPIAEKEAEAEKLAAEMRTARERAAAVVVYADEKAVDTVVRLETHLTRQLSVTLDLLDRLQGGRSGGDRSELTGLFRGLAGGSRPRGVGNGFVS